MGGGNREKQIKLRHSSTVQVPLSGPRNDERELLALSPSSCSELTPFANNTQRAIRLACLADISSVQNQPMVCVALEFGGNDFFQLVFHGANCFSGRQLGAIGDAEDMGVDRNRRFTKSRVEYHVGRFATDAG